MSIFDVVILSLVEGATEFLPISSTGHLILTSQLLGIEQTNFVKSFEIFIQLGAISAVSLIYFRTLLYHFQVWKRVITALLPTLVVGSLTYGIVKNIFLESSFITIAALFLGGILLILLEFFYLEKRKENESETLTALANLSYGKSFLIGLSQSISVVPGVSRAASTIIGGMFMGLSRRQAVEFSFFLAVPTLAAASGLDFVKESFNYSSYEWMLLAFGFVLSFISAAIAVKLFLKFISNHSFIPFGIYRVVLAIVYFLFVIQ